MNRLLKLYPNLLAALLISVLAVPVMLAPATEAAVEYEQLLVFVQPGASDLDSVFQETQMPAINVVAGEMNVPVHVIDARDGAPEAIALTPLLVFQNFRGRSVYQGRTTTPDRVRNFIRTSRFVPQSSEVNRRSDIPIWEIDRTRLWAPIKIASVTGTPPDDYDDHAFKHQALKGIEAGFKHFSLTETAALGRADRGFYMDFYPWRSDDGTLFLSLALYSQFHCKEPIYEKKQAPLIGPWADRDALFREAAALMEKAVAQQIRAPETGDAFDPVSTDVPIRSWENLGFPLPPQPPGRAAAAVNAAQLGRRWVMASAGPGEPPIVQFRFPAPLDNNAGEVTAAGGAIQFAEGLQLSSVDGFVEVDAHTAITMGEPMLDEAIRGSVMLNAKKYPVIRFEIEQVASDETLAYGNLIPAVVNGTLVLKGKRLALSCPAEFEAVIGEDGEPRLITRTAFKIDLREFDIEGAEGPAPQRHTLLFDVHLSLKLAKG